MFLFSVILLNVVPGTDVCTPTDASRASQSRVQLQNRSQGGMLLMYVGVDRHNHHAGEYGQA